jgi:predicted oxidoreductase
MTMETNVNLCLELGINIFDHADIYGSYQAEALFGEAMSRKSFKREDIVLFTKCGLRLPHDSQPYALVNSIPSCCSFKTG